jgi:sialate O-acetylesterase
VRTACFFQTLCIFIKKISLKLRALIILQVFFMTPLSAQVITLRGSWKFHLNDNPAWATSNFNDTSWESIYAPSPWEEEGFNGYDGFAWYRKKFDGKKLDKNENYYLRLGFIDDADEVYVNGKLIGFSGTMPPHFKTAYTMERKYILPNEVINFNGENTIAIRIFDVTHAGGIVDGDLGIYDFEKNRHLLLDLQGVWSFATAWSEEPIKNEGEWKKIIVPGQWEHQGYTRYDGFAWYKKTFTLPDPFTTENLVLLLGKIDDFDKVFLNGKFIGSTNDHRSFGRSFSFQKLRAYTIPPALLKKKGVNTIEVFVEDMGNVGGIYEGPVGITTQAYFDRYFNRD